MTHFFTVDRSVSPWTPCLLDCGADAMLAPGCDSVAGFALLSSSKLTILERTCRKARIFARVLGRALRQLDFPSVGITRDARHTEVLPL